MKHCEIHEQKEITDKLREECGVFGIYDFSGENVASTIYYGLFALQHRGQESCGIAVSDTKGPKGKVLSHKGMGLVNEVFDSESMEKLAGDIGVGHVRYSTAGGSTRENAQPLVLNYIKGTLALAHNGNLINAPELRDELAHDGAIFQTTIDSEVIAYHIARERVHTPSVERAVAGAMKKLKGAYSLVVMSPRKLIGARLYGRRQHLPFQNSGRSLPGDGFTGRSGSCCRCTGVRKRSGAWIFSGIGHSIRHCICEKRLCRSDLHQTEAEQPGIERACEAECTARGSRRKACDYDRRLDRARYDE